jgi:hypothetical protein
MAEPEADFALEALWPAAFELWSAPVPLFELHALTAKDAATTPQSTMCLFLRSCR